MEIRTFRESDAAAWWKIRLESLESDPFAFSKAVEEHRAIPVDTIAQRFRDLDPTSLSLGAFDAGGNPVGMAAFKRETGEKEHHKGRIYGVYVSSAQRSKGIGRTLLARLLELAGTDPSLEQILLAVATSQDAARRLYRSLGFETFGIEPRAMRVGATYVDVDHMVLRIR